VPRVKRRVDGHRTAIRSARIAYLADGKVFDLALSGGWSLPVILEEQQG
jgi:hypothetical protein